MIDITNQTKNPVPRQLILKTLKHASRNLKIKSTDLSVVFVSQPLIKKLNFNYRHQNQATDVLSFSYNHSRANLDGEIIICYSILKKNARHYGHSIKQELVKILIHSLLHLIGYDHAQAKDARQMENLENKIIKSFKA